MEGYPRGAPTIHVADHPSLDELRKRAGAETDKRLFVRIQSVSLAAGQTMTQIAQALGSSRRAVQLWVAR